ncbi:pyridoxamine 5'-phosphate oxidase family protein [Lacibacter sediminis]|uniref:Pyridoxamine 5'-phosphate oxidase family protein n=1 Tax=Lacibacter sediminis TaxID=2760713 RepID=A0A7G5XLM1_9BACT|nr:pyridoxamine 5'-phosphate oxidase family protein [Lacibacter sediminis]QNA46374.1 pyridoxamine 5'-phosphate oxidase family protein [Lacibacter sediminis]
MGDHFLQYDLQAIEVSLWELLLESVKSFKAPFHTGSVATVYEQRPEVRTVVLRHADAEQKKLFFHTDTRSPKVRQLQINQQLSWLFYDKDIRMQLRLAAVAVIHTNDEVANEAWEQARLASRLTYTTSSASGTILTAPELINLSQTDVEPELITTARNNFCVVETTVQEMDWVLLHHTGNRRALFNYNTQQFQWIQV